MAERNKPAERIDRIFPMPRSFASDLCEPDYSPLCKHVKKILDRLEIFSFVSTVYVVMLGKVDRLHVNLPVMPEEFRLTTPLPNRRSAEVLRDRLIDHLIASKPKVGDRFLSDHELVRSTQLSRPTVRRALADLHREGWIERRQGRGTFVGPRAALALDSRPTNGNSRESSRRLARLAVLIHLVGDFQHDWYSRAILEGMDTAAADLGVSIELLGESAGNVQQFSTRLMQSRPDALALFTPLLPRLFMIGEALRLGIPCIGTGSFLAQPESGIPCVVEDGVQGSRLAIDHLTQMGHTRIALVQRAHSTPWIWDRYRGYVDGLQSAGIDFDERLVCWLQPKDVSHHGEIFRRFLDRQKPTAVFFSNQQPVQHLTALVHRGLRIGHDLSVVHFDQAPHCRHWLGMDATHVKIPLEQMGRRLARWARDIVEGRPPRATELLFCELHLGASVANLNRSKTRG
jgi:DNA-binding LacI/PurR family transcriptional regulator